MAAVVFEAPLRRSATGSPSDWKELWAILYRSSQTTPPCLAFYDSRVSEDAARHTIDLTSCTSITRGASDPRTQRFAFFISIHNQLTELRCAHEQDLEAWIAALNEVVFKIRPSPARRAEPKPLNEFPWLHTIDNREKAEEVLMRFGAREGLFLVRASGSKKGCHALSLGVKGRVVHHLLSIAEGQPYLLNNKPLPRACYRLAEVIDLLRTEIPSCNWSVPLLEYVDPGTNQIRVLGAEEQAPAVASPPSASRSQLPPPRTVPPPEPTPSPPPAPASFESEAPPPRPNKSFRAPPPPPTDEIEPPPPPVQRPAAPPMRAVPPPAAIADEWADIESANDAIQALCATMSSSLPVPLPAPAPVAEEEEPAPPPPPRPPRVDLVPPTLPVSMPPLPPRDQPVIPPLPPRDQPAVPALPPRDFPSPSAAPFLPTREPAPAPFHAPPVAVREAAALPLPARDPPAPPVEPDTPAPPAPPRPAAPALPHAYAPLPPGVRDSDPPPPPLPPTPSAAVFTMPSPPADDSAGATQTFPVANVGSSQAQVGEAVREQWIVAASYEAPAHSDRLSISEGDMILIMKKFSSGWWLGKKPDGSLGWVPSDFLDPGLEVSTEEAVPPTYTSRPADLGPSSVASRPAFMAQSMHVSPGAQEKPRPPPPTKSRSVRDVTTASSTTDSGTEGAVSSTRVQARAAAEFALQMALNASGKVGGPKPRPASVARPPSSSDSESVIPPKPVPAPRPPSIRSNPLSATSSTASLSAPPTVPEEPEEDEEESGELYIDMRDANIPQAEPQAGAGRGRGNYEHMELRNAQLNAVATPPSAGQGEATSVGEYLAARPVDDREGAISEYIVAQPPRTHLPAAPEAYEALPTRSTRHSAADSSPAPPLPPGRPATSKPVPMRHTRHDAPSRQVPNELRLSLLLRVKSNELSVDQVESMLQQYESGVDLPPELGGPGSPLSAGPRSSEGSSSLQDTRSILEKHRQSRSRDSMPPS